jgi:hypothetical protein
MKSVDFHRALLRALASALVAGAAGQAVFAQAPKPDCTLARPAAPVLPATIPIELHGNHVAFWVCRGDKPLMFVLDTGAGNSIIDIGLARSLGTQLTSSYRATGAGSGSAEAAQVRGDSVTLPGASVVVPLSAAIDLASIAGPEGSSMQGILGADFISRYIIALDYHRMEMRLYDRSAFVYEGPGTIVPFTIVGAFIHVRASIGLADGAHVSGDFVVDVGSALALALAKPFVERNSLRSRVGPSVHRPSGRGVGGPAMADIARVPSLDISGVEVNQPIVSMYGDSAGVFSSSSLGDGNIGGDILRRFTVYFDYRAHHMIWEPHEATSEPFETDMSGLQLAVNRGTPGFTVEYVVPQSPAGELGMAKGDVVVEIDGKPATTQMLDDLRKRFRRDGEHVRITVKRGATPVVFSLVTRRLI